uniref:Nudix hydrolase domain-containing protein n=1 Tax=Paramoeba aestuarina TaxID=180227 RepID=A0A7S4PAZ2_9EUKA|mmetsp:Transcript_39220/g.62068  ORF Transcript_39220/g.62068 Transcript_39220/m.62068 type:complete len:115 (+) Transcript_39220:60-404(+)
MDSEAKLLSQVKQKLSVYPHHELSPTLYPNNFRSSVCIILRTTANNNNNQRQVEVLFLKRTKRKGDPWSGDVCFPGGHHEEDETEQETCERECYEEIGLNVKNTKKIRIFRETY